MLDDPASVLSAEVKARITEAQDVLRALEFPDAQTNPRSAMTLLALLDLRPTDPWCSGKSPLMGITPIMDFMREHYGTHYAPNTRETVRRFTMHQFVASGMVVLNPDQDDRATNSPRYVYQIAPEALILLRRVGSEEWSCSLAKYRLEQRSLRDRYERRRQLSQVSLILPDGSPINLSAGKHNQLVKQIIQDFAPRFTPGGEALYIGDTADKFAYINEHRLQELGAVMDSHQKLPDVIIYDSSRNWLVLVEAVTSHGPISAHRREELAGLFSCTGIGLVYITAFPNRRALARYVREVSWETEVWVADAPDHLVHFDGERFLGPVT